MKKFAIATVIALVAASASALEVGTSITRDYSDVKGNNGAGLSVGTQFGKVSVTAALDQFKFNTPGPFPVTNEQDRFSVVAGYDVYKVGPVTVAAKVGAAYLDNGALRSGFATTVGAGATLPLTKTVSFGVDVARQYGQSRVSSSDGNTVTAGLRYRF